MKNYILHIARDVLAASPDATLDEIATIAGMTATEAGEYFAGDADLRGHVERTRGAV